MLRVEPGGLLRAKSRAAPGCALTRSVEQFRTHPFPPKSDAQRSNALIQLRKNPEAMKRPDLFIHRTDFSFASGPGSLRWDTLFLQSTAQPLGIIELNMEIDVPLEICFRRKILSVESSFLKCGKGELGYLLEGGLPEVERDCAAECL